jgi:hypothetical protein
MKRRYARSFSLTSLLIAIAGAVSLAGIAAAGGVERGFGHDVLPHIGPNLPLAMPETLGEEKIWNARLLKSAGALLGVSIVAGLIMRTARRTRRTHAEQTPSPLRAATHRHYFDANELQTHLILGAPSSLILHGGLRWRLVESIDGNMLVYCDSTAGAIGRVATIHRNKDNQIEMTIYRDTTRHDFRFVPCV